MALRSTLPTLTWFHVGHVTARLMLGLVVPFVSARHPAAKHSFVTCQSLLVALRQDRRDGIQFHAPLRTLTDFPVDSVSKLVFLEK